MSSLDQYFAEGSDKYIIIQSHAIDAIVRGVNSYMTQGYKPQGGICVIQANPNIHGQQYYQAMVK